jgi:hypothetical protein
MSIERRSGAGELLGLLLVERVELRLVHLEVVGLGRTPVPMPA